MSAPPVPVGWDWHTASPRCWATRSQPLAQPDLVKHSRRRKRVDCCAGYVLEVTARPEARLRGRLARFEPPVFVTVRIVSPQLLQTLMVRGYMRGPLSAACRKLDAAIPRWVDDAREAIEGWQRDPATAKLLRVLLAKRAMHCCSEQELVMPWEPTT